MARFAHALPAVVLGLLVLGWVTAAVATPSDDTYVAGYAAAVLERELGLRDVSVDVKEGVVTVRGGGLAGADRTRIVQTLGSIRGVVAVTMAGPEVAAPLEDRGRLATGFLRPGRLFDPLIADPRWPHFSAAYHRYLGDGDFADVASVSFGETISLYRWDLPWEGQLETGLQASVFAIFDLDAESHDLINADYFVGLYGAHRRGDLQLLARLYHQSSHLGDEFLLRSRVDRVNLSYEAVDAKVAYGMFDGVLRPYVGGGILFDRDPPDLARGFVQYGLEFSSPWTLAGGAIAPIAAIDVGQRQQNLWQPDLSLRAGVQFQTLTVYGRSLAIMLEYFSGHSLNGQFFTQEIDYLGLGVHLY